MCFWSLTNCLGDAKWRSPSIHPSIHLFIYPSIHLSIYPSIHLSIDPLIYLSILGWSNENIWPHNSAENLYVWLACICLLVPKSSPRFPFLSLRRRVSDDRKLSDPRARWPELLWRDLVYNRIIMRVAGLITLDDTCVERNQRRSKSHVIEGAVLRKCGLAKVFILSVPSSNVEQGVAKVACVEWRALQIWKAPFDAPEIWQSGGCPTAMKNCVTMLLFGRTNFRRNLPVLIQE
jgi:hypothetical protein